MAYHKVLQISIRMNHHQALPFTAIKKKRTFGHAIILLVRSY